MTEGLSDLTIEAVLASRFPGRPTTEIHQIHSLRSDLAHFDIRSESQFTKLLDEKHRDILQYEKISLQRLKGNLDKQFNNRIKPPFPGTFTLVGLARIGLQLKFGERWERYQERFSEVKTNDRDFTKYTFGKLPSKCPHTISIFYKYRSAEAALRLLQTKTLAWSSPLKFEDPLDLQLNQSFPFTQEELLERMVKMIHETLSAPNEPPGEMANIIFLALVTARQKRIKAGEAAPSLDQIRSSYGDIANNFVRDLFSGNDKNIQIWNSLLRTFRVLCLTDDPLVEPLWKKYANSHSGVVLGFHCSFEHPNIFWLAKEVNYCDGKVHLASVDEWAAHLVGRQILDPITRIEKFIFSKTYDWSFEKEWRVARLPSQKSGDSESLVDLITMEPAQFHSIHLGPDIAHADKHAIIDAAMALNPDITLYEVQKNVLKGGLESREMRR